MSYTFGCNVTQKQLDALPTTLAKLVISPPSGLSKGKQAKKLNLARFEKIQELEVKYEQIESMPASVAKLYVRGDCSDLNRFLVQGVECLRIDHVDFEVEYGPFKVPSTMKRLDLCDFHFCASELDFSQASSLEYLRLDGVYDAEMQEKVSIDLRSCALLKELHIWNLGVMDEGAYNIPNLHLLTHLTISIAPQLVLDQCTSLVYLCLRLNSEREYCWGWNEVDHDTLVLKMPKTLLSLKHHSRSGQICVLDITECSMLQLFGYSTFEVPGTLCEHQRVIGLDQCRFIVDFECYAHLNSPLPSGVRNISTTPLNRFSDHQTENCKELVLFSYE